MQSRKNNEVAERQMQMAYFNASQQSAKAKQLERMVHLKEQKMAALNDEMRELRKWNLELITTLENMKDFRGVSDRKCSDIENCVSGKKRITSKTGNCVQTSRIHTHRSTKRRREFG